LFNATHCTCTTPIPHPPGLPHTYHRATMVVLFKPTFSHACQFFAPPTPTATQLALWDGALARTSLPASTTRAAPSTDYPLPPHHTPPSLDGVLRCHLRLVARAHTRTAHTSPPDAYRGAQLRYFPHGPPSVALPTLFTSPSPRLCGGERAGGRDTWNCLLPLYKFIPAEHMQTHAERRCRTDDLQRISVERRWLVVLRCERALPTTPAALYAATPRAGTAHWRAGEGVNSYWTSASGRAWFKRAVRRRAAGLHGHSVALVVTTTPDARFLSTSPYSGWTLLEPLSYVALRRPAPVHAFNLRAYTTCLPSAPDMLTPLPHPHTHTHTYTHLPTTYLTAGLDTRGIPPSLHFLGGHFSTFSLRGHSVSPPLLQTHAFKYSPLLDLWWTVHTQHH